MKSPTIVKQACDNIIKYMSGSLVTAVNSALKGFLVKHITMLTWRNMKGKLSLVAGVAKPSRQRRYVQSKC